MIKILKYGEVKNQEIFARVEPIVNVEDIVTEIIKDVKENGDSALYKYCEKFDKAKLDTLLVTKEEIDEAYNLVDKEFIEVLTLAKENIYTYHEKQKRDGFEITLVDVNENGIVKVEDIEKAIKKLADFHDAKEVVYVK